MRRPVFLLLFISILFALLRTKLLPPAPSPMEKKAGGAVRFEGTVTDVKIKDYCIALTVKTGNEKVLVRINDPGEISEKDAADLTGRKIEVSGTLSLPSGRRNPGCFDYRTYLKGKRINTICDTNRYKAKAYAVSRPFLHRIAVLKADFYEMLKESLGASDFGMSAGILFGDTSYMDDEYYAAFQRNGIAHILAVSGLHVNMTYDLAGRIFGKRRTLLTDAASAGLILFYAALSGFSLSVVRASSMILLKIAAFNTDRRYDSPSAISLTASCMLLLDPFLLYSSGMHLSFAAAYSMAAVYPFLQNAGAKLADRYKKEWIYKASEAAAPGLSAFIGTAPLCAFHFLNFNPLSLLINPVVIALAGIILPLGLAAFAASLILPEAIASFLIYLDAGFLAVFLRLLDLANRLCTFLWKDSSCIAPPPAMVILFYAFLFFLLSETRLMLKRRGLCGILAAIETGLLAVCIALPFAFGISESIFPWEYGTAKVTFLDVGQGDCIHIHMGGNDVLIDGGGSFYSNIAEDTLKPYLLKNGIRDIDLAIVTHEDRDHSKGIYELSEIFEVKRIAGNHDVYNAEGMEENDSCIITSVEADGAVFLFMSDADMEREESLISSYPGLRCDVLKLGHHGSAGSTGEGFLEAVKPSFAVISVGRNNSYGHPSDRVIELLDKEGIIYARTDLCGAVRFIRAGRDFLLFENAAKDIRWHIPRTSPKSTLQGP